jgi:hypothetical protein
MQRGYIIFIVGVALLISGIVVDVLWSDPFAGKILREDFILSGAVLSIGGIIVLIAGIIVLIVDISTIIRKW